MSIAAYILFGILMFFGFVCRCVMGGVVSSIAVLALYVVLMIWSLASVWSGLFWFVWIIAILETITWLVGVVILIQEDNYLDEELYEE